MEGMKPVTGSGGGTGNGQPVIVAPTVNQGPVTEEKTALGGQNPTVDPSGLRYHAGLGFLGVPQP